VPVRRTIGTPATTVAGVGIHTGAESRVTLRPGEPGAGIRFRRDGATVPAGYAHVVDTSRCTVLGAGGATVSTVEHLLSACAGLGVTDLTAEVEGPELPIGDGSSLLWADALRESGLTEIGALEPVTLPGLVTVADGKRGVFLAARPSDRFRAVVHIAFDHPLVGVQTAAFDSATDDYAVSVAPARTFGFIEEVEALLKAGLAKGGSFDNALVVYPDRYSAPLRFPDELARHKLLDLMGDLLLATGGVLPRVDVVAVKPSHRANAELAGALAVAAG
jgi:UDP-3-O-[3-hydroxymyristoyl] N-acetylglucosamine deacetylase